MKEGCVSQHTKPTRSVSLPVLGGTSESSTGIKASRTSRWRAAALITLNLLMVAHFVQWRLSGSTVTPIEPSEAMQTLQTGAVNAGFIFFALAILVTLIFGRFVCGWGCHLLALQDLCAWLMRKIGLTPRPFRSRLLVFVPLIVALYMFVWPTIGRWIVQPSGQPLIPEFTDHLVTSEFWATFPPFWVAVPFLFICGFMTVYFLGSKGFCTYACPYGGIFGLADKVAPGRIRVTDACNSCGHCTAACTSNVIVHAEVKQYGMVVDPGCMKCMDCVSVCPNDALYFGFGKPAGAVGRSIKKSYSLSWPEEALAAVVFCASFFAVWDVYQLVPMLMALGIAGVTTFLILRTLRLFGSGDLSFHRFNLRSAGTIKKAGWAFLSFAVIWIGLNTHSGWVRYHERAGAIAFARVHIPDELALAQADPSEWLDRNDRVNIAEGRDHFERAMSAGLFVNNESLSKLAWFEYLSGEAEKAVSTLDIAANHQDGTQRAMSLYYRGAVLNRLGDYRGALTELDRALAERPDLITAREERGESLWQLEAKDAAVKEWEQALAGNPRLALSCNFLAAAARESGKADVASAYEARADQLTPTDARFHWMLASRLSNVGMRDLAEKHFALAAKLDPALLLRRKLLPGGRH
ncbi:MAG: 4Fe-4S binding protein [Acidobacteria bacterium]|nr:4Fe-4S binding protein [Acidobacteriota bacterium]